MEIESLKALAKLLDEVLELPPAQRESWMTARRGDDALLVPMLRQLLESSSDARADDWLEQGPAWSEVSDTRRATRPDRDTVGPYRLLRLLGSGGMGDVWLAERFDGNPKRLVALKLPVISLRREILIQRFARERDIAAALAHPNIARLYDAGIDTDGQPYLALEYVEGERIDRWCEARQLDVRGRIALLLQVLDAVQYAHAHLVVHRDLKPTNILVTGQGRAMLLDFGIAKLLQPERASADPSELTHIGGRAMTPQFAAPEQLTGGTISIATDVWACGVLLFELVCGRRPFESSARSQLEVAILQDDPRRLAGGAVSTLGRRRVSELQTIVAKALRKAPGERYATASALADDLTRWLRQEPVLAKPSSPWYRARTFAARHRLGVIVGGTTVAIVVAAVAVSIRQGQVAEMQARIARDEARTAEAVQTFIEGIFLANSIDQVDPVRARLRTAKQLLDEGAARIDDALRNTPAAKLRLLSTLAALYENMAEVQSAVGMLRRRADLTAEVFGAESPETAFALADLGRMLAVAEELPASRDALRRAETILERHADPSGRAEIARDLGLATLYYRTDPVSGIGPARRVIEAMRNGPANEQLLSGYVLLGLTLHQDRQLDAARLVLEEGVRAATTAPGIGGGPRMELHIALASVVGDQGDIDAAREHYERALRLSTIANGPTGLHALVTMGRLGNTLSVNGRPLEGLQWLERSLEEALGWPDSPDRTAHLPGFAAYSAEAALRAGRPMQALDRADLALRHLDAANSNPRWFVTANSVKALALLQMGRLRDAEAALTTSQSIADAANLTNHSSLQTIALGRARLLARQNAGIEALMHWQAYMTGAGLPGTHQPQAMRSLVYLVEFELAAGRPGDALSHADDVIAMLASRPRPENDADIVAQVQRWRGEALLKLGRIDEAIPVLQEAILRAESLYDPVTSPWVADTRLVLADALRQRNRQ